MQSDETESSEHPSQAPIERKEAEPKAPVPLRREAVFMATERHRSALLAACCSLAGVGLGFGLSQMAAVQSPCAHQVTINQTQARAELPIPSPAVQGVVTWLGVEVQSSQNAMPGAHVTQVVPGSPAEAAGLDVGDVIVRLGQIEIASSSELVRAVRAEPPGSRVEVTTVNYQGERHEIRVVLEGITPRELRALD